MTEHLNAFGQLLREHLAGVGMNTREAGARLAQHDRAGRRSADQWTHWVRNHVRPPGRDPSLADVAVMVRALALNPVDVVNTTGIVLKTRHVGLRQVLRVDDLPPAEFGAVDRIATWVAITRAQRREIADLRRRVRELESALTAAGIRKRS